MVVFRFDIKIVVLFCTQGVKRTGFGVLVLFTKQRIFKNETLNICSGKKCIQKTDRAREKEKEKMHTNEIVYHSF